jgi:ferrous iron transport protein B
VGNPNAGKSSLFNLLTGLHQKIGNFPGVTVERKVGVCRLSDEQSITVIDLPGTYSLYPKSPDEQVVFDTLSNRADEFFPDVVVVVADASNLKRNLLLFTQIHDLGMPVVLALNMIDVAEKKGIRINLLELSKRLNVPVTSLNARSGAGVPELKNILQKPIISPQKPLYEVHDQAPEVVEELRKQFNLANDYQAFQLAHQYKTSITLAEADRQKVEAITQKYGFQNMSFQAAETIARYELINRLTFSVVEKFAPPRPEWSNKLDKVLTHKIGGYAIFFAILFIIFQAIFAWASYPMDWIDGGVASLNEWLQNQLPDGTFTRLLTEGLIAGLGGVVVFIPQIALLFAFIAILEESGYMARVMYIMDKVMRPFGLNGRSVVPLISGVACAVPAIMATRSIDNYRDRLITIMITPLMSCSARIPIFTVLIALVVPETHFLGIFNLQGIALMGLYLLGFVSAILSAWILKSLIKSKQRSFFIMELPSYKMPRWQNVGFTILEKVQAFVFEAGKIIVAISIVLWVLASYGPSNDMQIAEENAVKIAQAQQLDKEKTQHYVASCKLEQSYIGHFGRFIEPTIKPLGFDWKIGIALITSFAAREVFIGTMATIYSIGSDTDNEDTIKNRMRAEINPETGKPLYTPALAFSLLVFYVFAMQCMSTVAIVYRETKGWKWPLVQFVYMTTLAYLGSFIVYHWLK